MNELVSVIVPIYNVEKYLHRCVDSIVNQSYANLEIILVDDGSIDDCSNICEYYKTIDKRISVIHKENGGLSSARNAGIDVMRGKYCLFIDSDDYIDPEMISTMLEVSKKEDADIVTCRFVKNYDNGKCESFKAPYRYKCWSGKDALIQMFYSGGIAWSACNKIYKSSLFDNVRYKENVYMEDMATTYRLYEKCNAVVETPYELYHYFIRTTGITGQKSPKRAHDSICNLEEMIEFFEENYPELAYAPKAHYGKIAPNYLVTLFLSGEYEDVQIRCINALSKYWSYTMRAPFVKMKYKPVILIFTVMCKLFGEDLREKKWFFYLCKMAKNFLK